MAYLVNKILLPVKLNKPHSDSAISWMNTADKLKTNG